jgi:hypothetical protein
MPEKPVPTNLTSVAPPKVSGINHLVNAVDTIIRRYESEVTRLPPALCENTRGGLSSTCVPRVEVPRTSIPLPLWQLIIEWQNVL